MKLPQFFDSFVNDDFLCTVKILILHQHFKTPETGGAIRSWYLGRALVEGGHQVTVISARSGGKYRIESVDGMEVHYLPTAYDNRFGFTRRIVAFIRFAYAAVRLSRRFRRHDLCYAMSVPLTVGVAARIIKRLYGMPFIFEVGDLWPDAPVQMGVIRNTVLKWWLFRLEKAIYLSARRVVALSDPIREAIELKCGRRDVTVITNMADVEFFVPSGKDPSLAKRFGVDDKFVVSYIGAVGAANELENLVACARRSQASLPSVRFVICGDGARLEPIKKLVASERLSNISIVPFKARKGVQELLNVTDAVFISYKPIPILETGSPNKFFDGIAAGKLVVVNFGGWIADEIIGTRCGVRVDPNDASSFVHALRPFVENKDKLREYQYNARALAENRYARRKLSEKLLRVVEDVGGIPTL